MGKKQAAEPNAPPALSTDDITDRAHAKFGPKLREQFSRGDVREVVAWLDLRKLRPSQKVPRLVVRWLRFTGMKEPTGKKASPIDYTREFAPGVNVILIEDNLVGKSTILKTIKFALTGDDGDYDDDVKGWIRNVWLRFTLDDREYTILLGRREDGLHGLLVPGKKECQIEEVPVGESSVGFRCKGVDDIQAELRAFFVHEFKLASMGWTQAQPSGDGRSSECWASWHTFFQALRIPDDDHTYLLCKPDPGLGNQEQLLFSAFLGLHLIEPLNQLSMEASSIKKKTAAKEDDADRIAERKRDLNWRRKELQSQLTALDDDLIGLAGDALPGHDLSDEPGLGNQGLPQVSVEAPFSWSFPCRGIRPSRCSTSASFHRASTWCRAMSRLWTLVPVPIFCVVPKWTRTCPGLTFSKTSCFLPSESASPMVAISARGIPAAANSTMISSYSE